MKKSNGGGRQIAGMGCAPAPGFARSTGMPKDGQLKRPVSRPDGVKQLAYPGSQGGRSSKNPKE